jgi:hypothetical protein
MFDKLKEWISDFKVWATALLAAAAEWAFGIIDAVKGLIG